MEIKRGDSVYVFSRKQLRKHTIEINDNMFGKIISIDEWLEDDDWGMREYICVKITIELNNRKIIRIKYSDDLLFLKRYRFIKIDVLNELVSEYKQQKTLRNKIKLLINENILY